MSKAKPSPLSRKLSIQLGVCRRMRKEAAYYVKEEAENRARVQKMKDDQCDPFDVKKQQEVLDESVMMIPDSRRRLGEVMEVLREVLGEVDQDQDKDKQGDEKGDEKVEEARALLKAYEEEQEQEKEEQQEEQQEEGEGGKA